MFTKMKRDLRVFKDAKKALESDLVSLRQICKECVIEGESPCGKCKVYKLLDQIVEALETS